MTLSVFEGHFPIVAFSNGIFRTFCTSWRDFDCQRVSRGPSAIAELLV